LDGDLLLKFFQMIIVFDFESFDFRILLKQLLFVLLCFLFTEQYFSFRLLELNLDLFSLFLNLLDFGPQVLCLILHLRVRLFNDVFIFLDDLEALFLLVIVYLLQMLNLLQLLVSLEVIQDL
jgi:hypothetical protein